MADQIERLISAVTNGLNKINTSIQKTQTYKDGNIYGFGGNSTVNSSGVAALLGFLGVLTLVPGSTAGASDASGSLDSQSGCEGVSVGASSITGSLSVSTELGSSAVETSGASAALGSVEISTKFSGSIVGASNIDCGILNSVQFSGSSVGASGETGVLSVSTRLVGSCAGATTGAAAYMWT